MWNNCDVKFWLSSLVTSIVAMIAPIGPLLITIGFLIAIDFVFGIYKAFVRNEEITSRKMGNTISKSFMYSLAVIALWLIERNIIPDVGFSLSKIGAAMIAIVEVKSIDESFKGIFGWSLWTKMVKIFRRGSSNTKDFI